MPRRHNRRWCLHMSRGHLRSLHWRCHSRLLRRTGAIKRDHHLWSVGASANAMNLKTRNSTIAKKAGEFNEISKGRLIQSHSQVEEQKKELTIVLFNINESLDSTVWYCTSSKNTAYRCSKTGSLITQGLYSTVLRYQFCKRNRFKSAHLVLIPSTRLKFGRCSTVFCYAL